MEGWIGIAGTIVAALLAFIFGRVNLSRTSEHERSESLRQQRLDTFGAFCAAVVQYRRAQLHRWFEGSEEGRPNAHAKVLDVDEEVRAARADAWAAYYRMLMLTEDKHLAESARGVLTLTRSMEYAESAAQLDRLSDDVHDAVDAFARRCLPQVAAES